MITMKIIYLFISFICQIIGFVLLFPDINFLNTPIENYSLSIRMGVSLLIFGLLYFSEYNRESIIEKMYKIENRVLDFAIKLNRKGKLK